MDQPRLAVDRKEIEAKAKVRWLDEFKSAHLHSWPIPYLMIAKEIYERDEALGKAVSEACNKYGYKLHSKTLSVVTFVKVNPA